MTNDRELSLDFKRISLARGIPLEWTGFNSEALTLRTGTGSKYERNAGGKPFPMIPTSANALMLGHLLAYYKYPGT